MNTEVVMIGRVIYDFITGYQKELRTKINCQKEAKQVWKYVSYPTLEDSGSEVIQSLIQDLERTCILQKNWVR